MISHEEEGVFNLFEDISKEVRSASDLSAAATREALIPTMSREEAEAHRGIPVTRACGVHLAQTLKALHAIQQTGKDADFVSVAERKPKYGTHVIRLWRIPRKYGN